MWKLTDAGSSPNLGWAQVFGGAGSEETIAAAVSGTSVYLTGYFSSPMLVIGGATLTNAGTNTVDVFVAKLTDAGTTGAFVWGQRAGGPLDETITTVAVNNNKLYVTGTFGYNYSTSNSSVVSAATFGSTTIQSAGGGDIFVSRLTDTGNTGSFDWTQQAGGTTNDYANALLLNGTSVYVVGYFSSPSINFGTTLTNAASGLGASASFLASLTDPILPTRNAEALVDLSQYPNPAHGTTTVRVPAGAGPASLTLLDALGRAVRTQAAAPGTDCPLDLTGMAPGVYALRVRAGEALATRQLVVE